MVYGVEVEVETSVVVILRRYDAIDKNPFSWKN
jgi:hypothetical protein